MVVFFHSYRSRSSWKSKFAGSEGEVVTKGQELGYFDYGGSDVIAIFEHSVTWDADIYNQSHGTHAIETLIHVNEQIATFASGNDEEGQGQQDVSDANDGVQDVLQGEDDSSSSSSSSSSSDDEGRQQEIYSYTADVRDIE